MLTRPCMAAAGLTAVALDLPGYGRSAAVDPDDLAGMAAVARNRIERIPDALLQTVPGAGHWLPMEHPDVFNTARLAFSAGR